MKKRILILPVITLAICSSGNLNVVRPSRSSQRYNRTEYIIPSDFIQQLGSSAAPVSVEHTNQSLEREDTSRYIYVF